MMKNRLFLSIALIFGVMGVALILVNGFSWSQNIDNEPQAPVWARSEPTRENNNEAILWNTSA